VLNFLYSYDVVFIIAVVLFLHGVGVVQSEK
jgi:hypothetical protein